MVEHLCCRANNRDGIGKSLTGNVWGAAMDRFEDRVMAADVSSRHDPEATDEASDDHGGDSGHDGGDDQEDDHGGSGEDGGGHGSDD